MSRVKSAVERDLRGQAPSTERIYLDNHATTPVDPRVAAVVVRHLEATFGNPSSVDHAFGDEAERVVAEAAEQVGALVGADPADVVFTAGATESSNLALQGFARWASRRLGRVPIVAVSAVEHRAVLETARALAADGRIALQEIPVDGAARVDLEALQRMGRRGLDLVCVMGANNEVGTVYPVVEIGRLASEAGAAFFCDGTQAVGKVPLDVAEPPVTFLALTAHKIYGPKGVGALVVPHGAPVEASMFGGGHQHGIRPGTLNVPGIAGLGEACRLRALEMDEDESRIAALRNDLEARLLASVPELTVNGARESRLAGNLHVALPKIPNQAIIARIRERVAIATGAACSSGIEAPSHVLRAMGLSRDLQEGALRIGVGKFNTMSDIETAASLIEAAVNDVRTHGLTSCMS